MRLKKKKKLHWYFPAGTVDRNHPANAGDTDSIPGLGRFHMPQGNEAHAPQLLMPAHLEPVLPKKGSPQSEALAQQPRAVPDKDPAQLN